MIRRLRNLVARWIPASARPLVAQARSLAKRAPSPIATKVTDAARTVRDRRRDEHRGAFGDDAAYFDDIVGRAIASAQATANSADEAAR